VQSTGVWNLVVWVGTKATPVFSSAFLPQSWRGRLLHFNLLSRCSGSGLDSPHCGMPITESRLPAGVSLLVTGSRFPSDCASFSAPKWYSQYRFYLSILVGTCIIGSLAGISYYGPVAGHGLVSHDLQMIRAERSVFKLSCFAS
jgi:hypothetical protein